MKNKSMKAASAVVVLSLLAACMMSGTLAKYTTGGAASDKAKVAKWGVEVQAEGYLFGDTYGDGNQIVYDTDGGDQFSVQSSHVSSHLVAPGTGSGEGMKFSVTGTPEVAGEITSTMDIQNVFLSAGEYGVMVAIEDGGINADNYAEYYQSEKLYVLGEDSYYKAPSTYKEGTQYYLLQNHFVLTDDYYPVVYSLSGSTLSSNTDIHSDSLKVVADLIAAQLGITANSDEGNNPKSYTGSKSFDPNTNLADASSVNLNQQVLTWDWAFENGANDEEKAMYNSADTLLGMIDNLENGIVVKYDEDYNEYSKLVQYTDYNLETQFDINITVTQTD